MTAPTIPWLRIALLGLLLPLLGCEESTVGPTLEGTIDGRVLSFDNRTPVEGASVTTSPATGAFVTDADGRFRLTDVEAGTYTISVRRSGFATRTVTASVRDGMSTPVTVFLEGEKETGTRPPVLDASIVNWANRAVGSDSTFVDVEVRIRNESDADVARYEVYVQIETPGDPFFYEVRGDSLRSGQADIETFSKYIRTNQARAVSVDTVYAEAINS
jgi:TolB protein